MARTGLLTRACARAGLWLSRKRTAVPAPLTRRMDALRLMIRKGGPGSDLAAAELQGIRHTLMWLAR